MALCEKGFDISDEAILGGIAGARFPARIEVLSRRPLVVLALRGKDHDSVLVSEFYVAGANGFLSEPFSQRVSLRQYFPL